MLSLQLLNRATVPAHESISEESTSEDDPLPSPFGIRLPTPYPSRTTSLDSHAHDSLLLLDDDLPEEDADDLSPVPEILARVRNLEKAPPQSTGLLSYMLGGPGYMIGCFTARPGKGTGERSMMARAPWLQRSPSTRTLSGSSTALSTSSSALELASRIAEDYMGIDMGIESAFHSPSPVAEVAQDIASMAPYDAAMRAANIRGFNAMAEGFERGMSFAETVDVFYNQKTSALTGELIAGTVDEFTGAVNTNRGADVYIDESGERRLGRRQFKWSGTVEYWQSLGGTFTKAEQEALDAHTSQAEGQDGLNRREGPNTLTVEYLELLRAMRPEERTELAQAIEDNAMHRIESCPDAHLLTPSASTLMLSRGSSSADLAPCLGLSASSAASRDASRCRSPQPKSPAGREGGASAEVVAVGATEDVSDFELPPHLHASAAALPSPRPTLPPSPVRPKTLSSPKSVLLGAPREAVDAIYE